MFCCQLVIGTSWKVSAGWFIFSKREIADGRLFPKIGWLRACLHGGGGPQVGEVKYGGSPHLSCKRDQIKMRDYMNKRVTPPKRVTSATWGPPPPCKQALSKGDDEGGENVS